MPLLKRSDDTGLAGVGEALDSISWHWLSDNHYELAQAIDEAVGRGASAEGVRRFVMHHAGRAELAQRCYQAARHLVRSGGR